jgi:hypothetical protein
VPSCWEQHGFGTYYYGTDRRGHPDDDPQIPKEQGKYRREFELPPAWKDRAVRIVFDGAMTDTEVKVNGQLAGLPHQGAFYRFNYDITALVKFGEKNLLEVTVSKESANPGVNRAERRGDYWTFGGIFRPVWLEARPARAIEWIGIDARANGEFAAQVHFGTSSSADGTVTAEIFDAGGAPVGRPLAAEVLTGRSMVEVRGGVEGVKPWTAETPVLYRVRFTLSTGSGGSAMADASGAPAAASARVWHTVTERFGFRTFEVRPGDGLYLNGQKIVLKGINRHCFWPETARTLSRENSYADVRLIKEMNMNAVRMSHYPPDVHFLEACDELGLYVLDELSGWQGCYDSPAAARLTGEMVRRDVNHPSILFWDNGNEGGWNTDNDGEFVKWDPQQRSVLHPWALFSGVNTKHYPNYELMKMLAGGPDLFMPTEFLHGLYDGGIGAGLRDYWDVMGRSPTCAGGFFWVFADEGVVRTDQNERIDTVGSAAPDGILGPHHEKEGSFFTVKEIWSPVQITAPAAISGRWDGTVKLENHYDFTNLDQCSFAWSLVRLPDATELDTGRVVLASGTLPGPAVPPHGAGRMKLELPKGWHGDAAHGPHALYLTAKNAAGAELWTWSWPIHRVRDAIAAPVTGPAPVVREEGDALTIRVGAGEYRFSKETGRLAAIIRDGKSLSLANGPRFLAFKRDKRDFGDIAGAGRLTNLAATVEGGEAVVTADYEGALQQVSWRISPGGRVRMDYDYTFQGEVDLLGVQFDYPEAAMKEIRWLGWGPYRVWQNRLQGTRLDVWRNAYNDTTPTESWVFPEFKGYFRDWQWAVFSTTEGALAIENGTDRGYLGVYRPNDGPEKPVLNLPLTGLAVLDVIPAMGSKFTLPEVHGPESQSRQVSGAHHGRVYFQFDPR